MTKGAANPPVRVALNILKIVEEPWKVLGVRHNYNYATEKNRLFWVLPIPSLKKKKKQRCRLPSTAWLPGSQRNCGFELFTASRNFKKVNSKVTGWRPKKEEHHFMVLLAKIKYWRPAQGSPALRMAGGGRAQGAPTHGSRPLPAASPSSSFL